MADYQTYLKAYPGGKFANVAKKRIEELSASTQTTDTSDETAAVARPPRMSATIASAISKCGARFPRPASSRTIRNISRSFAGQIRQGREDSDGEPRFASAPADDQQQDAAATTEPADDAASQDQAQDQAQSEDAGQQDQAVESAQADDQPQGADWEQEYALWKAASDGNTVTEYEAYIKAYPNGKFAAIAQARASPSSPPQSSPIRRFRKATCRTI